MGRQAIARSYLVDRTSEPIDDRNLTLAQPSRRLSKRIKHYLKVKGRATDDLEHIGGCRLLLQRFAQLVKQSRVLDGDHCLRGEIFDQLDLLVGKRVSFLSIDGDRTLQFGILEHRHDQ